MPCKCAHLAGDYWGSDGPCGGQGRDLRPHDAVALGAEVGGGLGALISAERAHLQLQVDRHRRARGAVEDHRGAARMHQLKIKFKFQAAGKFASQMRQGQQHELGPWSYPPRCSEISCFCREVQRQGQEISCNRRNHAQVARGRQWTEGPHVVRKMPLAKE